MPCNPLTDPACAANNVITSVAGSAANDVLNGIAQAVTAGVKWIVENRATWWLYIPSPDLAREPALPRQDALAAPDPSGGARRGGDPRRRAEGAAPPRQPAAGRHRRAAHPGR